MRAPFEPPPVTPLPSTDRTTPERLEGICLSGGGLRAASFALGALQALDERRGLLRGPRAARWLSVVSGGSYIGATLTLLNAGSRATYCDGTPIGASDLPAGERPLAPGSPEVAHLLRHCRYLIDDGGLRTSLKVAVQVLASLLTVGVILTWAGVLLLGDIGLIGRLLWTLIPPPPLAAGVQWLLGLSGVGLVVVMFATSRRTMHRSSSPWRRGAMVVICLAVLALAAYLYAFLLERLVDTPPLRSGAWLWHHRRAALAVAVAIVSTSFILQQIGRFASFKRVGIAGNAIWVATTWLLPWCIVVCLVCWAGVPFYEYSVSTVTGGSTDVLWFVIFFGVLWGAVAVQPLPGLVSPHRPYMEMLSRCFAIGRDASGRTVRVPHPGAIALSSLRPLADLAEYKYPELVICASANVVDPGFALAGANSIPLVISGETVTVPGAGQMQTRDLERMSAPQGWMMKSRWMQQRWQLPLVSLMSSVAVTGAALSPMMGRMTRPRLRPLLAALNVRFGVWLPNPVNPSARQAVSARESRRFTVGVDQLLLEFVGLMSSRSTQLYVSDGGHYENLGLVQLIRERCRTIWCVDASGDPPGRASALADAILLAQAETGCRIDIDLAAFRRVDRRSVRCHVTGRVTFPDGGVASLHVVKLGLTEKHSSLLQEYELADPGFPYHPTTQQVYKALRFESYRQLGWETTSMLLEELGPE